VSRKLIATVVESVGVLRAFPAGTSDWRYNSRELFVAKLIYSAITSLDGYVADDEGTFEWAMPDAEVHTFVNDL
jgi:hypothetical protein